MEPRSENLHIAAALRYSRDPFEASSLAAQLSDRFCVRAAYSENPLFQPLRRIVANTRKVVPYRNYDALARQLEEEGLPVRIVEYVSQSHGKRKRSRYYLVPSQFREDVTSFVSFLEGNENMVEQIAGPTADRFPTSFHFKNPRPEYVSIARVFKELGIKVGPGGEKIKDLLESDCPIPVFMLGRVYRCRTEDIEEFKEYLRSKKAA